MTRWTTAWMLLVAACNGDSSSPGLPDDAAHQVAEEGQLDEFSRRLTEFTHVIFTAPTNLEDLVGRSPVVFAGTLVAAEAGRRSALNAECGANGEECAYRRYMNLVLAPVELARGFSAPVQGHVYLELPWPRTVGIERVSEVLPVGTRILLLGEFVEGAAVSAEPLGEAHLIPELLVQAAPYGLIVEGNDGAAALPLLMNTSLSELVEDHDARLSNFDSARTAIFETIESP